MKNKIVCFLIVSFVVLLCGCVSPLTKGKKSGYSYINAPSSTSYIDLYESLTRGTYVGDHLIKARLITPELISAKIKSVDKESLKWNGKEVEKRKKKALAKNRSQAKSINNQTCFYLDLASNDSDKILNSSFNDYTFVVALKGKKLKTKYVLKSVRRTDILPIKSINGIVHGYPAHLNNRICSVKFNFKQDFKLEIIFKGKLVDYLEWKWK